MDCKTVEAVNFLSAIKNRPSMYFGSAEKRSYSGLCMILLGFKVGASVANNEELYWGEMELEVQEEFSKMTEGKVRSDQELFDVFFEALDLVLRRDYPQFTER